MQNRFKKILVPLDGSLNSIRGLNEAISLARQSGSTITGIYLMPSLSPKMAKVLKSYRAGKMKFKTFTNVEKMLADLKKESKKRNR